MRPEISEIKMFYRSNVFGTLNSLALSSPVRGKVVYESFKIKLLREFLEIGEILKVTVK